MIVPEKWRGKVTTIEFVLSRNSRNLTVDIDDVDFKSGILTGDLSPVSLNTTTGSVGIDRGSLRFSLGDMPLKVVPLHGRWDRADLVDASGLRYGRLLFDEPAISSNVKTKQIWFAPAFSRELRGSNVGAENGQWTLEIKALNDPDFKLKVDVVDGFSKRGDYAISPQLTGYKLEELNRINVAKLQQRLNYIGARDAAGKPLAVDGIVGPSTQTALKNLKAKIKDRSTNSSGVSSATSVLDSVTLAWLNALNAVDSRIGDSNAPSMPKVTLQLHPLYLSTEGSDVILKGLVDDWATSRISDVSETKQKLSGLGLLSGSTVRGLAIQDILARTEISGENFVQRTLGSLASEFAALQAQLLIDPGSAVQNSKAFQAADEVGSFKLKNSRRFGPSLIVPGTFIDVAETVGSSGYDGVALRIPVAGVSIDVELDIQFKVVFEEGLPKLDFQRFVVAPIISAIAPESSVPVQSSGRLGALGLTLDAVVDGFVKLEHRIAFARQNLHEIVTDSEFTTSISKDWLVLADPLKRKAL